MQLLKSLRKSYPLAYSLGHKKNKIRNYYIVSSSWQEHEFLNMVEARPELGGWF